MRCIRIVAPMVLLAGMTAHALAAQQLPTKDPMEGTWKLNVARSTFTGAAPQATTYRYENLPDGSTLWVSTGLTATGNPTFNFSIRRFDDRDYPTYNVTSLTALIKQNDMTPNTTQSMHFTDMYSTELLNKTDGVVTGRVTRTMARDGRTFTMKTYTPAGELQTTQLFEKVDQPPPTN
jgi:hypothetical protein